MRGAAPCLMVGDVARAQAYFADKLGFSPSETFGDPPSFGIAERDGAEIMFARAAPETGIHPNADHPGRFDAYFWVRNASELHAEFAIKGADLLGDPVDRVYGMREVLVRGPDGHVLCFGQTLGKAA